MLCANPEWPRKRLLLCLHSPLRSCWSARWLMSSQLFVSHCPCFVLVAEIFAFAFSPPSAQSLGHCCPDIASLVFSALADVFTVEALVTGSKWPVTVMVLACEPILSWIAQGIELITPMTQEVEPADRRSGIQLRASHCIVCVIVRVGVHVHRRIPKRAAIGHIVEKTERQNVFMSPWRAIHSVCSGCRVANGLLVSVSNGTFRLSQMCTYSVANLLNCFPLVRLAPAVLAEKH
jgi:hypothetical protein